MLCLLGAEIFAKTALIALFIIFIAYLSFLFTIFFKPFTQILIPTSNKIAYLVTLNLTDSNSKQIVNLNQTLTADYTSFRFVLFYLFYF